METSVLELLYDDDVEMVEQVSWQPIGNTVFVMQQRHPDMLTDGWKWKVAGSARLPAKRPLYRRSLYYYDSRDGVEKEFQKKVFERLDNGGRVVIMYVGQPNCTVPAPHGNSRSDRPFVRTNPTILQKIKEAVNATSGEAGPSKLYKEAIRTSETDDLRAVPRDMKQVRNVIQATRDSQRTANDGVANISRRLLEVDYIHVLEQTRDNLCVVVGLPDMLTDFKEAYRGVTPTLYYDTTFNMGDFYVSALLYRHTVFANGPIMPLMMLIHERRTTDSHELLFRWLVKLTGIQAAVFVVDREPAITNAIVKAVPSYTIAYCWNHIVGDVRAWVKSNGGTNADEQFYASSVRDLLAADSATAQNALLESGREKWSPAFIGYYDVHLASAVTTSAQFAVQQLDLVQKPYLGITNNVSESYNRVLKDFQNWKERPLDTVVEGFAHLQQYHIKEVLRGLAGTGQYVLKPGFPVVAAVPVLSSFSVEPASIVSTLQEPSVHINQPPPPPSSTEECLSDVAHAKLLSGRVQLMDGIWIVDDNIRMHDKFMVKLSDSTCSCNFPSCIHMMAVRLAAGLSVMKAKRPNLSALRRKCRSGRKQGRKRGLDKSEQYAPDSVKAKQNKPEAHGHPRLSPITEVADSCAPDSMKAEHSKPEAHGCSEILAEPLSPLYTLTSTGEQNNADEPVTASDKKSCRRSLLNSFNEALAPEPPSPGVECAIVDVESGKSPASLIASDGRWLTGGEVDAVQTLLKARWEGHGLLPVTSEFASPMPRPFVQVLFSPTRRHWLTVHGGNRCVYVYDSIAGSASQTTQQTVRTLAGKRTRVVYNRTCTQQTMTGNCGCFALAYAATIVLGGDPASYELLEDDLRSHLANVVRSQELAPFPCKLHCYCNRPASGRMVACDGCDNWFHVACLSGFVDTSQWLCQQCS